MTCIVASRRFVCADRRIAEDGGAYTSIVKVAKNGWLIAAAAGLAKCTLAVKRAVRDGAQAPEDLLPLVDSDSYAVALTWDGRLFTLSEGALWDVKGPAVALGSGGDLALGFMHGVGMFTPRIAQRAQRFVAKRRSDCGDGCDIRSFE